MSFESLMMKLQGFNTSVEAVAALGAELRLRSEGLSADSRLSSVLQDVVLEIEPGILEGLDHNQERAALALIQTSFRQAQLTHMGNPWLFRCRPNDIYSARVIADYGVNTLGKKKWAIVHSTDAFGANGMKNLVVVLKRAGVEPVLIQGYTNNSQDFTPVVLAVKQSGADVLSTYIPFAPDLAIFARQLRQLGINIAWVGSPSTGRRPL